MKTKIKNLMFLMLILALGFSSCEDNENPEDIRNAVEVNVLEMNFSRSGGDQSVDVSSDINVVWGTKTEADWISFSTDSGISNGSFVVTADENLISEARTSTVSVFTSTDEIEINVTQEPGLDDTIPNDPSNMSNLTSVQLADELGSGINIGNTLEAICSETAWGNPEINQDLINGLKDAGFESVRIPIAWSCYFSDEENFKINSTFFNRVEEVVNMVIDADMYAVINIHWDGGWMNEPTYEKQDEINHRLDIMWKQIALNFRDYDYHLIFAGTNEVMFEGDFSEPTDEYADVQNSFNQTFINTVRATGGRNAFRYLAVQTFNTNIDYGVNHFVVPNDPTENRMLLEVHYYDPFQFTLDESSNDVWQWGPNATNPDATAGWGDMAYLETQLDKLVTNYVDNGIGVFIGEFGAIRRDVTGNDDYVADYLQAVVSESLERGIATIYWDNGPTSTGAFGLFNRSTGEEVHPELIDALTEN
jgi:endoglucanase